MTPQSRQRYRRHRILGLLPALVLVGGGLYLGLAQRGWLGLVAGALFLLLSAVMIATDRPTARSNEYGDRPSARQPGQRSFPAVRRRAMSQPHSTGQ
ncbi:MAG TPA: hypothetical protein VGP82_08830 [Ktedonobacterales bacterium]|jgi:hypothetical protein|nr:hypothetical protein [Ktedonobacterales bacterium]